MNRLWIGCVVALGCAGGGDATSLSAGTEPSGSRGVTVGGATDVGELRAVIAAGNVPDADLLDDVGFFAEHALDLPAADCGEDLCVLSSLAVAPKFDGGNWAMAYVALQTPLDPATLPREPVHVVVALELTASVQLTPREIRALAQRLAEALRPEDRVSLFGFHESIVPLLDAVPSEDVATAVFDIGEPQSALADLYAALDRAEQIADADTERSARVLVISSGLVSSGITDPDRVSARVAAMAEGGTPVSVIGYRAPSARQLRALAETGGGTYSHSTTVEDLGDVMQIAGETNLHPLARGFELELVAAPGYEIGNVYGAPNVTVDSSRVSISAPALYIGAREGSDDLETGRRGGGSGFFIELRALPDSGIGIAEEAFTVRAQWTSAQGQLRMHEGRVFNGLAPGQNPDDMWPHFSNLQVTKPFMMLNMYFALRLQLMMYESGDCSRARGVLPMMEPSVEGWQRAYSDPDIDADMDLVRDLDTNITRSCVAIEAFPPVPPVSTAYSVCMYS